MDDTQKKFIAEAAQHMMLAADRLTGAITSHTSPKDDGIPANPIYDRPVWQAANELRERGIELELTLPILQRLFDRGKERGLGGLIGASGTFSDRKWAEENETACTSASDVIGQYDSHRTKPAEERYPRPNDPPIGELYRDPIVQCPECRTAIYPGEGHECRGYVR